MTDDVDIEISANSEVDLTSLPVEILNRKCHCLLIHLYVSWFTTFFSWFTRIFWSNNFHFLVQVAAYSFEAFVIGMGCLLLVLGLLAALLVKYAISMQGVAHITYQNSNFHFKIIKAV